MWHWVPNVQNYGTIFRVTDVSLPNGFGFNQHMRGIYGPLINFNSLGDIFIDRGHYTNCGFIDRIFVRQGPIENNGTINSIFIQQGTLTNRGQITHLYIKDGEPVSNYGIVHNLYRVRACSFAGNSGVMAASAHQWNPYQPNIGYLVNTYTRQTLPQNTNTGQFHQANNNIHGYSRTDQPGTSNRTEYEIETDIEWFSDTDLEIDTDTDSDEWSDAEDSLPMCDTQHKDICCRICLEAVKDRHPVSTRCGHIYCKICIKKSLRRTWERKCPTCNMELPAENPYHRIYI